MVWFAEDPITDTEPCVQRLFHGAYLETAKRPQGLKLAWGLVHIGSAKTLLGGFYFASA
jgi:hypothetical protein